MPHLFYYLDFTVSVFVVHREKVLLADHRQLDRWLPLGGHIEPGEDPEQAALREVAEESGLAVELCGERPPREFPGTKRLVAPVYLDVHDIAGEHRHIGMIYYARATSDRTTLSAEEHRQIRWFDARELQSPKWKILDAIQFYAADAIRRLQPAEGAGSGPADS